MHKTKRTNAVKTPDGLIHDVFKLTLPLRIEEWRRKEINAELITWIRTICTQQEVDVLIGYYGLLGEAYTLAQIAGLMQCGQARMGHVRIRAIKKLVSLRAYAEVVPSICSEILEWCSQVGVFTDNEHTAKEILDRYKLSVQEKQQLFENVRHRLPDHMHTLPLFHTLGLSDGLRWRLRDAGIIDEVQLYVLARNAFLSLPKIHCNSFAIVVAAFAAHGIEWPLVRDIGS